MEDKDSGIWPHKHNIFGVSLSETTYDELLDAIIQATKQSIPAIIDHMPVHGLMTASRDPCFRSVMNGFDVVAPDGQPVRWALNLLHKTKLLDRVYGPEFMLRLCRRAAEIGVGIYLYGSQPHVVEDLRSNLIRQFPSLQIVGYESPPFRPLTQDEDKTMVERINSSGAQIVFLGLGCPLQEKFAYEHKDKITAVQICVGAAFDFHAGLLQQAPRWMQNIGLEWFFRLWTEPRRLWKRYLVNNSLFIRNFVLQFLKIKNYD